MDKIYSICPSQHRADPVIIGKMWEKCINALHELYQIKMRAAGADRPSKSETTANDLNEILSMTSDMIPMPWRQLMSLQCPQTSNSNGWIVNAIPLRRAYRTEGIHNMSPTKAMRSIGWVKGRPWNGVHGESFDRWCPSVYKFVKVWFSWHVPSYFC